MSRGTPLREIYAGAVEIVARKRDGRLFRHKFRTRAPVIGLADGSLYIPRRKQGRRFWTEDAGGEPWLINPPKGAKLKRKPARHTQDSHCTVKRGRCSVCAVSHAGKPCPSCKGRAFHWVSCPVRSKRAAGRGRVSENNPLVLINDGGSTMARRRKKGTKVRRRRRRTAAVAANPIHRRRRSSSRRRRRVHRNPPRFGRMAGGLGIPPMKQLAGGVVGAVASRVVPGYLAKFIPQVPTTGPVGLLVRAGIVVGLGKVAGKFVGRDFGNALTFGGLVSVADEAASAYLLPMVGVGQSLVPVPVGSYLPGGMSSYLMGDGEDLDDDDDYGASDGVVSRFDANHRF